MTDDKNAFAYQVVLQSQEIVNTLRVNATIQDLTQYSSWLTTTIKLNNVEVSSELGFDLEPQQSVVVDFIFEANPLYAPVLSPVIDFGSSFNITKKAQYIPHDTFVMSYDSGLGGYTVHGSTKSLDGMMDALLSEGSLDNAYSAIPAMFNDGVNGTKPVVKIGHNDDFFANFSDYDLLADTLTNIYMTHYDPYGIETGFIDVLTLLDAINLKDPENDRIVTYGISQVLFIGIIEHYKNGNSEEALALFEEIKQMDWKAFLQPKSNHYVLDVYGINYFALYSDFFGWGTFRDAYTRTDFIEFEEGLKVIGKAAFANLDVGGHLFVSEILFPSTLQKIEQDAFGNLAVDKYVFKQVSQTLTIENRGITTEYSYNNGNPFGSKTEIEIHFYNATTEYFNFSIADIVPLWNLGEESYNIKLDVYVPQGSLAIYHAWISNPLITVIERA